MVGMFGALISGIQALILEGKQVLDTRWSWQVILVHAAALLKRWGEREGERERKRERERGCRAEEYCLCRACMHCIQQEGCGALLL